MFISKKFLLFDRIHRVADDLALYRELLVQAWPLVVAMAGETMIGLVDAKLVGGLGAPSLSGVGVAATMMWLSYSFAFGVSRGIKVRVAHAVGEGRVHDAARYGAVGALAAALYGIAVFAIGRDLSWAFTLTGLDARAVPHATAFFSAVTWGAPGACAAMALVQHRQGLSDARTPMIVTLVGNIVNAILGYALIYGHFGCPALGVRGAGFATGGVQTVNAVILAWLLARDAKRAIIHGAAPAISRRAALKEVLRVGVPTAAQFLGEVLAFSALTLILGGVSPTESAAHQISLAVLRMSFLPGFALGEAGCVLVGQALGARRPKEAVRAVRGALHLALAFMAACGIVFATAGRAIGRAFSDDPAVSHTVGRLLLLAAVFQILDAINIVYRCALRGAEDVRVPAIAGIVIMWTSLPATAYVLGRVLGWGAVGGWCGFVVETILGASFFAWRFRKLGLDR